MISVDLKPDKSDPSRSEVYNNRLNLVNFEDWEVMPPKSTKNFLGTKERYENACTQQ